MKLHGWNRKRGITPVRREEMNDLVMWVDPGETTGIAVYSWVTDAVTHRELEFPHVGEYLEAMCMANKNRLSIGWERFIITAQTARNSQAPWSLEVIGMTRWLVHRHGCVQLQPALPGDRELGNERWVRALGWMPPRKKTDRDAYAATQHLLAWMLRNNVLPREHQQKLFTTLDEAGRI